MLVQALSNNADIHKYIDIQQGGFMSKKSVDGKSKKHFESKFRPIELRELIASGKNATEIMKEMEIGHMQTLRQYVLKLMDLDKTFYEIPGLYKSNTRRPMCNFKQDIVIRKKMLENIGFTCQQGNEFDLELVEGKIVLSPANTSE